MKYIIDNNTLTAIFRHYFPDSFPNFWLRFNELIQKQENSSVREVKKEIEFLKRGDNLEQWIKDNGDFFYDPTIAELKLIRDIYSVKHFRYNLDKRKFLSGGAFADPFLIAKAINANSILITQEIYKDHAARIPNICNHFGVTCLTLEGFLANENWKF